MNIDEDKDSELYMIDCILRRGKIEISFDGHESFACLDLEEDNPCYRVINVKNEAIDAIIKQLKTLKD